MDQLELSIIIVNWNTREILRNCLYSVHKQTRDINYKLIVVDNASTDGSAEMVKNEFPHVVLIENQENRGFAAANNQGMKIAKGRYVLLLNSDTIVLDGAIQKTCTFADQHPEAAVVGCKALNPDRTFQSTCFLFPSLLNLVLASTYLYKLFPKSRFFGRERMTWWDRNDIREVEVVTGCFMLVRQEAIEQVGLIDEDYFMYAEETDWCYRFQKNGWKNLFYPHANIIHFGAQSSKRAKGVMDLQLRAGIMQFILKHKGWLTYRIACILIALFFLLRLPYWFFKTILSGFKKEQYLTFCTYLKASVYSLSGYKALQYRKK